MRVLIIRNHWVNIAKKIYDIWKKNQNKKYPQKQAKKPP